MATEKITVSNAQTLLPSGQPMTGPTYILPGTDEEDASSPFSPESTGPLNPVIAEFNIADDPNAPTTVVKYEYDHSEDCDVDFDSDPDGEEETAPVLAEQRSRKNKGDGSLTAGTHFRVRDAAAMSECKSDEEIARHQASVQQYPCASDLDRYEGADNRMAA